MAPPSQSRPWRTVLILALLTAIFGGLVALGTSGDRGLWTPRLGLDLAGGTQIVLVASAENGEQVTQAKINEAVDIIRERVDSLGVAESEVSAQGNREIVVSVPGRQGADILDLVRQTAQLRFRRVIDTAAAGPTPQLPPSAPGTTVPSGGASPPSAVVSTPDADVEPPAGGQDAPEGSTGEAPVQRRVVPQGLIRPAGLVNAEAPTATPAPVASPVPAPSAPPVQVPDEPPVPAGGEAGVPADVQARFAQLDCTTPEARAGQADDPAKYLAACDQEGTQKYLLEPARLVGSDVSGALPQPRTNDQGQVTNVNDWQVTLDWTSEGQRKWAAFTTESVGRQVAVVLDGRVVSAPNIEQAITGGSTSIYGDFSQAEATSLANVLRYGQLPLSFDPGTVEAVSATLGGEQLRAGLIAGGLGLLLVCIYSLLYYRALGLVNIASLAVGALLIYLVVLAMSNAPSVGLRLTLAGIAGLVIGIGIAADSFIVYFERIRDELREGKALKLAVEVGWRRARRTILAADFVSFLAAVVLYFLAIGAVRGFAVMLGLTTLIDILVVFLFTKPVVTLLARRKFFQERRPMSGLADQGLARRMPAAASEGKA